MKEFLKRTPKMESALSLEERSKLLNKLSDEQIIYLNSLKRYKILEHFETQNYFKDCEWEFVEYKENPYYKIPEIDIKKKLFCICGRELKYQFIVKSKKTEQLLSLGINHFSEHIGIDERVGKEIYYHVNIINLRVDEVLLKLSKDKEFPESLYQSYMRLDKNIRNKKLVDRLLNFRRLKLPLLIADEEEISKVLKREERKRNVELSKRALTQISPSSSNKKKVEKNDSNKKVDPTKLSAEELKVYKELLKIKRKEKSRKAKLQNEYKKEDSKVSILNKELSNQDYSDLSSLKIQLEKFVSLNEIEVDVKIFNNSNARRTIFELEKILEKEVPSFFYRYSKHESIERKLAYTVIEIGKGKAYVNDYDNLLKTKEELLRKAIKTVKAARASLNDIEEYQFEKRIKRLDSVLRNTKKGVFKNYFQIEGLAEQVEFLKSQLNRPTIKAFFKN